MHEKFNKTAEFYVIFAQKIFPRIGEEEEGGQCPRRIRLFGRVIFF